MTTGNRIDLKAVATFAEGVSENTTGIFFNPHTMAQTMLALVDRVSETDQMLQHRLRQYDRLTLAVSVLIEGASDMSKKELVAGLERAYRPDGDR